MTTNAARFAEFIASVPADYYFDDSNDELWEELFDSASDGKTVAKDPSRTFDVDRDFGGRLSWQGRGPEGPLSGKRVSKVFEDWEKNQVSSLIVCRVPSAFMENFRAYASANGIEIAGA